MLDMVHGKPPTYEQSKLVMCRYVDIPYSKNWRFIPVDVRMFVSHVLTVSGAVTMPSGIKEHMRFDSICRGSCSKPILQQQRQSVHRKSKVQRNVSETVGQTLNHMFLRLP